MPIDMSEHFRRCDTAISLLQLNGSAAHIPLLRGFRDGLINLVSAQRDGSLPMNRLRKAKDPHLILVGDDDDRPSGPNNWRCAKPIAMWASGVMVHAAGAEPKHYETAVSATLVCGRFALIETTTQHAPAWLELLDGLPTLLIWPRGDQHPALGSKVTLH